MTEFIITHRIQTNVREVGRNYNSKTSQSQYEEKKFYYDFLKLLWTGEVRYYVMTAKVYVDVLAVFSREGELIPKAFVWEDGRRYEIDKISKPERCASRKAGGTGYRYTCQVGGKICHLTYEENYKWFMERKQRHSEREPWIRAPFGEINIR